MTEKYSNQEKIPDDVKVPDKILQRVSKPTRYVGNEWNSVHKDPESVRIRFAFCFPDVYEVGMSHLGMKILYHLLNEREDTYCERVFAPWTDMEQQMRENNLPLFGLESRDPIKGFDFVGFTLQYEMSYTNILNMLDLSGIPMLSVERDHEHPFVCAGGPCAYNPEPLADFVDFFMMGEGEEVINEVMDAYLIWKKEAGTREAFLETIAGIEGIYVPSLYEVSYNEDGTVEAVNPKRDGVPRKVRKRIIKDMDRVYFPDKIVVPYMEIVHDRIMLELFRGCIRGCRFCQAGYIYRPVREKSPDRLMELAKKLEESTGYQEISLTSLSTSDYTQLEQFAPQLMNEMEERKVNLSLPSLRVDNFSLELMEQAQKVRKSGLTFAPEAGSQRLRDVINKGVTEEDLIHSVSIAFGAGWNGVKLYFMIGLPTETYEDLDGIAALGDRVVQAYYGVPKEKRGKGLKVTISASSFVPKPFTPFQWEAQDTMETLREKQKHLKGKIKNKNVSFSWHDPEISFLEAVFARGDRRIAKVLHQAWKMGCRFDGWSEHFKFDRWMEAFAECGIDPSFYANRARKIEETLPWDHIDVGVTKKFFIRERERAYRGELTDNCRADCSGCGAVALGGEGICR